MILEVRALTRSFGAGRVLGPLQVVARMRWGGREWAGERRREPVTDSGSHRRSPGDGSMLDAHAWVEVDGHPLLTPAPRYGRLVTL